MKQIRIYQDYNGRKPLIEWLDNFKDIDTKARILKRLRRIEQGNFGDCQPIGEGLSELRMFFGAGYRVYFGQVDDVVVLLLCGGDKSSQNSDIIKAKQCWKDFKEGV
jgi:putative addiction module killer protein